MILSRGSRACQHASPIVSTAHLVVQRLIGITHQARARHQTDDRMCRCQRLIISRELPRRLKHNRTCQVSHDRTQCLRPVLLRLPRITVAPRTKTSVYITTDQTQPQRVRSPLCASIRSQDRDHALSGTHDQTRRSKRGLRPVTSNDLFLPLFPHRVDPLQLQVLSPLQMCQHHRVYTTMCMCVSFSQTFLRS